MWHIMYKNKKGIPQYHISRTESKYFKFLEYIKKEGCEVQGCWKEDTFGNRTILLQ